MLRFFFSLFCAVASAETSAWVILSNTIAVAASEMSLVQTRAEVKRAGDVFGETQEVRDELYVANQLVSSGELTVSTHEGQDRVDTAELADNSSIAYGYNRPGCSRHVAPDTRVLLMDIVPKFHSSTSLAGVLMSSPNVTTLCSANVWECEGDQIIGMQKPVPRLWKFGEIWDLNKTVLLEKGPRRLSKTLGERGQLMWERRHMPQTMMSHGIKTIKLAYIIMFRPMCLASLSHNARVVIKEDAKSFMREEVVMLEEAVTTHKMLLRADVPVIIMNLGDMMWRIPRSKTRLQSFLPCVGELNFSYVPVLGKDVFEGNAWKMAGSIRSFGEGVNPQHCCKYNVEGRLCEAENGLMHVLSKVDRERAELAYSYLVKHS
eukprot:TRINITY_DN43621_c0_g1_i1.p1 TRINITY_DN43621_c0_g1~~TRINITY_DN43621_c0_g1_i1.p1  ORF type:complete len:376 (+),score=51.80 TRINITY_DN43621_c0_g1_i1:143-1270(+)